MSSPRPFSPPPLPEAPEIPWVLAAAFSLHGLPPSPPPSPERLRDFALRLNLGPRIRYRVESGILERSEETEPLLPVPGRTTLVPSENIRLLLLSDVVARRAAAVGVPAAFLKFAALCLGGYVHPRSRGASDIDVLVPGPAVDLLQRDLLNRGFAVCLDANVDQHAAPLFHPALGAVEIHRSLPGVQLSRARRFATFEDLERGGHLVPAGNSERGSWRPDREVLVAHALAHSLAQHRWETPHHLLRMVADLLDLGVKENEVGPGSRISQWIGTWIPEGDLVASVRLANRLSAADWSLFGHEGQLSPEGILLRHAIGGLLNDDYRKSLTLARIRYPVTERTLPVELMRATLRAFFPDAPTLIALYGKPQGGFGIFLHRIWRPVDVLGRFVRYSVSWARSRRKAVPWFCP